MSHKIRCCTFFTIFKTHLKSTESGRKKNPSKKRLLKLVTFFILTFCTVERFVERNKQKIKGISDSASVDKILVLIPK